MICSTGWVHSNRLTFYGGEQPLPVVDHRQLGLQALYRLYPSRSGWTFIAALQQEEWVKLATALGRSDLVEDERFATPAARLEHDAELIATLDDIFLTDEAHAWEKRLTSAGVSAVAVGDYSFEEFLVNEQLVASDEHHEFGTYWRLPPRVRFSRSANRIGPPAALGEHTVRLLHEVGYTDDEVDQLVRDQIVVAEVPNAGQRAGNSH
jgi:crotonobetainyl-CoA:carnitine CoA-transferase CaiB-like acyl-CoA transferase